MPNVKLPTGVDLYYESHGGGEPLIFVPSTAFSCDVWKPSQLPLADSLNLVIHDPRGCGRSVARQDVWTIEQMGADIVALMDHLNIPAAHLLGHSMGGRIALAVAENFPGRVKSLIMAASGSGPASRPGPDCVTGLPHRTVYELVSLGLPTKEQAAVLDRAEVDPLGPGRAARNGLVVRRYSTLEEAKKKAALARFQRITGAVCRGLDVSKEVEIVDGLALGDTVLVERGRDLLAFGVYHLPGVSEAPSGALYVKFLAVDPQHRKPDVQRTAGQIVVQEFAEPTNASPGFRGTADFGRRAADSERGERRAVPELRRRFPGIEVRVVPLKSALERTIVLLQRPELLERLAPRFRVGHEHRGHDRLDALQRAFRFLAGV